MANVSTGPAVRIYPNATALLSNVRHVSDYTLHSLSFVEDLPVTLKHIGVFA